jgi:dihydrodipicolinate synthase/N-acetylneuraminate lyase
MKNKFQPDRHRGVIVPMVTPVTPAGALDEAGVATILEFLQAGGVHGVFVLGTTGESKTVPEAIRDRLVQLTVERVGGKISVYAGISDDSLPRSIIAGNRYLRLGADAVVAHVPAHFEQQPQAALDYFSELAAGLEGDLILYNMPLTTRVSLPIELCKQTAGRPRVIGIKDSENDATRMVELLRELGDKKDFAVFIGTGPLMAKGLLLGAEGIVPSVGNIAPALCRELYDRHARLMAVSGLYQNGRELGHSIATLKAAMAWMGLCDATVLPPLQPVSDAEALDLRDRMVALGLKVRDSGRAPVSVVPA